MKINKIIVTKKRIARKKVSFKGKCNNSKSEQKI